MSAKKMPSTHLNLKVALGILSFSLTAASPVRAAEQPTDTARALLTDPFVVAQARAINRNGERELAPVAASDSLEVRFWNSIKNSEREKDFRTYLDAYPDGQFAAQARARLKEIQAKENSATVGAVPALPNAASQQKTLRDCPECPELILIPAGGFKMGSAATPFETPVHQVMIPKPFYIGRREVTLGEWDACVAGGGCAYSPSDHGAAPRDLLPATNLDWEDAKQYVAWLSKKTGRSYRLPTESEWEYAARAGSAATYPWGWGFEKNRANCAGCVDPPTSNTMATASFPPNGFGLYDMAGNAAEWVEDCWHESYKSAPADGSAWTGSHCQERVLRGGAFNNDSRYVRSASRFKYDYDVRYYANGFRVVREASGP